MCNEAKNSAESNEGGQVISSVDSKMKDDEEDGFLHDSKWSRSAMSTNVRVDHVKPIREKNVPTHRHILTQRFVHALIEKDDDEKNEWRKSISAAYSRIRHVKPWHNSLVMIDNSIRSINLSCQLSEKFERTSTKKKKRQRTPTIENEKRRERVMNTFDNEQTNERV